MPVGPLLCLATMISAMPQTRLRPWQSPLDRVSQPLFVSGERERAMPCPCGTAVSGIPRVTQTAYAARCLPNFVAAVRAWPASARSGSAFSDHAAPLICPAPSVCADERNGRCASKRWPSRLVDR